MTFRIPWSEAVLSIIHSLLDSKVLGGHIIETIYSHTLSKNTHSEIIGECKQLKLKLKWLATVIKMGKVCNCENTNPSVKYEVAASWCVDVLPLKGLVNFTK